MRANNTPIKQNMTKASNADASNAPIKQNMTEQAMHLREQTIHL